MSPPSVLLPFLLPGWAPWKTDSPFALVKSMVYRYTRADIPKGGGMKGRGGVIRRWAAVASATVTLGFLTAGGAAPAVTSAIGAIHPAVTNDFQFISPGQTPPTEDQCYTAIPVQRRCFAPEAMRNSYNLGPLYDQGFDGTGFTVAVV